MTATRRIWIINHYAGHPSDTGGGSRHQSLASKLTEWGWEPIIFAASTDHRTREQRSAKTLTTENVARVRWRWIPAPGYSGRGVLRARNMIIFSLRLLNAGSTSDLLPPHIVVGSTVHPLAAWAALRLARRHQVPFVFEVRDLWPETLIQMKAIGRNGLAARAMRRLERHLYQQSDLIVTTMPAAYDYIKSFEIERAKVVWISNGADTEALTITRPPMNNPFQFLYFGAHGKANDLPSILQGFAIATRSLTSNPISLRFVGAGPLKPQLIRQTAALGLQDSVVFDEPVSKSDIPSLARSADALVMSVPPLDLYKYGISPNKLFDYLASARPILFAGNPVNNIVMEAQAGGVRPSEYAQCHRIRHDHVVREQ